METATRRRLYCRRVCVGNARRRGVRLCHGSRPAVCAEAGETVSKGKEVQTTTEGTKRDLGQLNIDIGERCRRVKRRKDYKFV